MKDTIYIDQQDWPDDLSAILEAPLEEAFTIKKLLRKKFGEDYIDLLHDKAGYMPRMLTLNKGKTRAVLIQDNSCDWHRYDLPENVVVTPINGKFYVRKEEES